MRFVFNRGWPGWDRVLLVESGPREVAERYIQVLRTVAEPPIIDVLTCFPGEPAGLRECDRVYRIGEFRNRRAELARLLRSRGYTVTGVLCANTPFMPKWRWWAAWTASPSKVMIVNENADWIWIDAFHARPLAQFAMIRVGFDGEDAAATIGRAMAFPFVLAYLLAFAGWVHLRRAVRLALRPSRS